MRSSLAPAIRLFHGVSKDSWYRGFIVVLTFIFYTGYHMSRKPLSVVKSQLHRNCSEFPKPLGNFSENDTTWCDWAPFDGGNYKELLGSLDTAFLVAYAIGMFLSGMFGERLPLRYYLSGGMVICGVFTTFLGLGYYWKIHALWYYILFQILNGVAQTTGWPSVVALMGNWFGKGKRGFIMGIWNSHTAVGNILGSLIAGAFVSSAWGLSFIVPGVIIAVLGIICFLFLVEYPEDVGCTPPDQKSDEEKDELDNIQVMNSSTENIFKTQAGADLEESGNPQETTEHPQAISFCGALRIPGVVEFSLCLLFAKLVSYTFLYWLPLYIANVAHFDPKTAGDMSTLFDAGGIVGGILAGAISDYTGGRAIPCAVMLILTAPMLFIYNQFGQTDVSTTVAMLVICGMLVNGPYSLITTAVSADLGTHESLHGNAKALSTVTAIIDGSGSIGAALGPTLASILSSKGWNYVFYMLIAADLLACLFLARLVYKEIKQFCRCCSTVRGDSLTLKHNVSGSLE
ncbi:PREDICTED: glucose-6-phosphate exchanger SLC37A2 isoform X1 [Nanorana parkeri]|uniref:glucose-6-phosphate exchanger SLC37A2 isoform X1 n=1 Tax=Nanorana parkeri TaxID=125878 RepID=UPI0008544261|nr:PREDICTED: glucose-6-phosphate exchanger SLC37A2 isoform X1 [Nanorana parkeri]